MALNKSFGKWETELNRLLNQGKLLQLKFFEARRRTPIDWDTLWLVTSIGTYTLNNNIEDFEYSLNLAIKKSIIGSYERRKQGYEIITRDGTPIRFLQLDEFLTGLDDEVKKRLHSESRFGHCHWDSIHLSENLELPNKVVSAYCTTQSRKMPYTHSWVELEHKGKEWVMDFTMNEMMNKEGYYKLYRPQGIVEIDKETLSADINLMRDTTLADKDIRMYLFYPNEAREVMQEEVKQQKRYKTGEFPWIMVEE